MAPCAMERAPGPIWPFVRTAAYAVEQALDLVQLGPSDLLVDAGCGDGQVCLAAARRGAHSIGWDLDEHLVQEAERRAVAQGLTDRCSFEHRDALGVEQRLYRTEEGPGRWLPKGTTVLSGPQISEFAVRKVGKVEKKKHEKTMDIK